MIFGCVLLTSSSIRVNANAEISDTVYLGLYPQTLSDIEASIIKANGTLDPSTGWYEYNGNKYAIKNVIVDPESYTLAKFNDGSLAYDQNNIERAFLVEKIKWGLFKVGDGYADFISTRIIDRKEFSSNSNYTNSYDDSDIKVFADNDFLSAFSSDEKSELISYDEEEDYYFDFAETADLRNYLESYLDYPSDYAIASNLSSHIQFDHGEVYANAPFWTKTKTNSDRVQAYWQKQGTTDCLITDDKIGFRPIIRITYDGGSGGKDTNTNNEKVSSTPPSGLTLQGDTAWLGYYPQTIATEKEQQSIIIYFNSSNRYSR